jgi:hypothetical protein
MGLCLICSIHWLKDKNPQENPLIGSEKIGIWCHLISPLGRVDLRERETVNHWVLPAKNRFPKTNSGTLPILLLKWINQLVGGVGYQAATKMSPSFRKLGKTKKLRWNVMEHGTDYENNTFGPHNVFTCETFPAPPHFDCHSCCPPQILEKRSLKFSQ